MFWTNGGRRIIEKTFPDGTKESLEQLQLALAAHQLALGRLEVA